MTRANLRQLFLDRPHVVMESLTHSHRILRFGVYEADLAASELRKHGTRIKIQEQPFQILLVLLEHPGELVTRDLLREKLWADDTFVDFDRSLNTALTKLRTALCDSADNPRFIQTIPRQGYRFVAPVLPGPFDHASAVPLGSERASLATPEGDPTIPPAEPLPEFQIRRWGREIFAAVVISVLALMAVYYIRLRRPSIEQPPVVTARRSVAVLGFKNLTGANGHDWLSTALPDWLSTELGAGEQLRIIPEENVSRMQVELGLPQVDSLAADSLSRIRKNLGCDLVVVGSFARLGIGSDANIRVDVRLQDTATGETVATVSELGAESRLFDLVAQTGEELRKKVGVDLVTPQQSAEVAATLPGNHAAAQLYAEGINKLRLFDARAARDFLQKVIVIEPGAPLPHSALATAWSNLGYDSAAVAEAKKASELSPGLSAPLRLLVLARYQEVSRNWEKAIQTYRSLFQSFPDNIDYGLSLANAQVVGAKWNDALQTLAVLRNLPPPMNADPRIDWQEGRAERSLGDMKRAEAAFGAAVKKSEAAGATLLLARASIDDAMAFEDLGNLALVNALVQRSKQLYLAAHDLEGVAVATTNEASVLQTRGESADALKAYEQALAVYETTGDKAGIAGEETNIASVLLDEGDLFGAQKHNERARELYRQIDEPDGVALAELGLADVFLESGRLLQAKRLFEASREICIRTGNRTRQAEALAGLSEVMRIEGDADSALGSATKAQELFAGGAQKVQAARLNLLIAALKLDKDEISEATNDAAQTLEVFEKAQSAGLEASAHILLSKSMLKEKNFATAREHIQRAILLSRKSSFRALEMRANIVSAELQASANAPHRTEGLKALRRIVADAKDSGFIPEVLDARLALAEAELQWGEKAEAREQLAALEKDASQRGWQLVARRAAADLNQVRF